MADRTQRRSDPTRQDDARPAVVQGPFVRARVSVSVDATGTLARYDHDPGIDPDFTRQHRPRNTWCSPSCRWLRLRRWSGTRARRPADRAQVRASLR